MECHFYFTVTYACNNPFLRVIFFLIFMYQSVIDFFLNACPGGNILFCAPARW